jgi:hypothetical protein
MKARLYFDVAFKTSKKTDAEGMASAMDNVIKCGMSALSDSWDEYGGVPKVGKVFVLDTKQALGHADTVNQVIVENTDADDQIQGKDSELGRMLGPVFDFLRKIAGKK